MMDWLAALQRWIYDGVRGEILAFGHSGDSWLLMSMAATGILFGALHALTPGHGKTILASYLAGTAAGFGRAISLAGLLAATHVLTAVLIAFFAAHLMERSFVGGGRAPALELLSRVILVGLGVWLLFRALRLRPHSYGNEKGEGLGMALATGLVPCPLTLFVVVAALARGVPQAGLVFAGAMLVGIAFTLAAVAVLAVVGRRGFLTLAERHGAAIDGVSKGLNLLAGVLLILFAGRDLLQ